MNRISSLVLGVFVCANSAVADNIFFGWDDNTSGTVPLTNRPHHDEAKAKFLAATGSVGTLDFDSLSDGPISGQVSFGSVTQALWTSNSGAGVSESAVRSSSEYDAFAFSGQKYYMALTDPNVTAFTITFGHSIRAIGFSFSDEADWIGQANNPGHFIDLGYGSKISMTQGLDTSKIHSGSAFFIGIVADQPFASMTIGYPRDGIGTGTGADAVGIDDMMVSTVPEPASLFGLLAGCSIFLRRFKK